MDHNAIDEIEQHYRVSVDVYDENGHTAVYRYVEFDSMSPPVQHIEAAAKAIADLAERLTSGCPPRTGTCGECGR